MDPFNQLIQLMSEELYQELKHSLELGRWQNGELLTERQKSVAMQSLIAYENAHMAEQERSAYIHRKEHDACDSAQAADDERPVVFKS